MEQQKKLKIEKKVMALQECYTKMAGYDSDLKEFLLFTHRPGWTTIAETILTEGLIVSMIEHIKSWIPCRVR